MRSGVQRQLQKYLSLVLVGYFAVTTFYGSPEQLIQSPSELSGICTEAGISNTAGTTLSKESSFSCILPEHSLIIAPLGAPTLATIVAEDHISTPQTHSARAPPVLL
ncbi:MAG TPA: hypothetical protein VLB02_01380 [Candidatus Paceibacterota bacterium]|nr:hypothetical protein [Candidatus Paceibacterota bacterium]